MYLARSFRFAVRRLLSSPLFTLAAVTGIAIAIGINAAVFAVVNGLILRPLPYKKADRLVVVAGHHPQIGRFSASYPDFVDLKSRSKSFEQFAAFNQKTFTYIGGETPEKLRVMSTSADFFPMFDAAPTLGRFFSAEEEANGGARVVVLSHATWQDRFNSNPNIIGQNLTLNSDSYTVIGVGPVGFRPPIGAHLWVPLQVTDEARADRGTRFLRMYATLRPGVTVEDAQSELSVITGQLEQQYADTNAGRRAVVVSLQSELTKNDRVPLLLTLGAVVFVLLIACFNLANLFMARALSRAKQVGICLALGASRANVAGQFLAESMLLAVVGGALGMLLATWARDFVVAWLAVSPLIPTNIDSTILLFTVGISLLTGLIAGLVPAIRISKVDPLNTLKEGGNSGSTPSRSNLLKSLISVEVGLALALTIGAILMYKSLSILQTVDLGFDPDNIAAISLSISETEYDSPEKQAQFFNEVLQQVKALPGAQDAALVSIIPLIDTLQASKFSIEGRPSPSGGQINRTSYHVVSHEYFGALKIPVVSGRVFTEEDRKGSPPVAVVSQKMARRFWPGEDPINRRFSLDEDPTKWITIVGIVGDVKYHGPAAELETELYLPFSQSPEPSMAVLARGQSPDSLSKEMRRAVWAVNRNQPLDNVVTMGQLVNEQLGKPRALANVISLFGLTALLLAGLGIYGITAFSVKERTREVGIRMALGAPRASLLMLIVKQSMAYLLIGVAVGLGGAVALSRVVSSVLYGVEPLDPTTYAVASLILLSIGVLASYIPARRASLVNPAAALRHT